MDKRSWWRCRGLSSCCAVLFMLGEPLHFYFLPTSAESDSWMIAISSETARERAQSENGHLLNLRLQEVTINAAHTIRDSFKPAWFAWFQVSGQTVLSGISMGASRATKSCGIMCQQMALQSKLLSKAFVAYWATKWIMWVTGSGSLHGALLLG